MTEAPAVSYCTVCDALPGECSHTGAARYLPDVTYVKHEQGWSFPEAERADMERRLEAVFGASTEAKHAPGSTLAQPLQKLVVEMGLEFDLDRYLETKFRAYYEREPEKASRLAERVLREARENTARNPAGFLAHRLKELDRSD